MFTTLITGWMKGCYKPRAADSYLKTTTRIFSPAPSISELHTEFTLLWESNLAKHFSEPAGLVYSALHKSSATDT